MLIAGAKVVSLLCNVAKHQNLAGTVWPENVCPIPKALCASMMSFLRDKWTTNSYFTSLYVVETCLDFDWPMPLPS